MDTTTRAASPLRQRMTEDMRMRKLEPRTQEAYSRAVSKLTGYLKRSPDTATVEDQPTAADAEAAATPAGSPAPVFVCRHCGRALLVVQTLRRGEVIRGRRHHERDRNNRRCNADKTRGPVGRTGVHHRLVEAIDRPHGAA